jgi:hypothetical protein
MTRVRCALAWVGFVVALAACGRRSNPAIAPAADYNTLTAEEINQRVFYSAYEAVQTLRPNWLSLRGPTGAVQVYVDDNHIGGIEILRTIRIPSVVLLRHIDGTQAPARYGAGHESGVILVTTRAASPVR